jgi:hypothetical protein
VGAMGEEEEEAVVVVVGRVRDRPTMGCRI